MDQSIVYGPHAEPVLDGFNLVVPDGEHLAIVGLSGVGKSSLAAILCGMLRPNAMRARRVLVLDGHEARSGDHDTLVVRSPLYRALVSGWHIPPQSGEFDAIRLGGHHGIGQLDGRK